MNHLKYKYRMNHLLLKRKKIKMKPKGPNDIVDILNDITNFGYSKIKLLTTQTNDLMHF